MVRRKLYKNGNNKIGITEQKSIRNIFYHVRYDGKAVLQCKFFVLNIEKTIGTNQ